MAKYSDVVVCSRDVLTCIRVRLWCVIVSIPDLCVIVSIPDLCVIVSIPDLCSLSYFDVVLFLKIMLHIFNIVKFVIRAARWHD